MKYIFIVLLVIGKLAFAQSSTNTDELYRGRHIIGGMNYGHPYTIFDRHNGVVTFMQAIIKIRR
jgi:hypothetical protein